MFLDDKLRHTQYGRIQLQYAVSSPKLGLKSNSIFRALHAPLSILEFDCCISSRDFLKIFSRVFCFICSIFKILNVDFIFQSIFTTMINPEGMRSCHRKVGINRLRRLDVYWITINRDAESIYRVQGSQKTLYYLLDIQNIFAFYNSSSQLYG